MPKLLSRIAATAAIACAFGAGAPTGAAVVGPHAADCAAGSRKAAMLVHITGLKVHSGIVRVQSYGGDPAGYFQKGAYLERIEVQPPANGALDVCMAVPREGIYAVSVRHDVNGSGKSDLGDGGGMSGNPNMSLMDIVFKRRPSPAQVEIRVAGVTRVPIVLNYVQGTSVKPLASVDR